MEERLRLDKLEMPRIIGGKQLLILVALEKLGGTATAHDIAMTIETDLHDVYTTIYTYMFANGLLEKEKPKGKGAVRFKMTEKGKRYLESLRNLVCVNRQS